MHECETLLRWMLRSLTSDADCSQLLAIYTLLLCSCYSMPTWLQHCCAEPSHVFNCNNHHKSSREWQQKCRVGVYLYVMPRPLYVERAMHEIAIGVLATIIVGDCLSFRKLQLHK